jgi:hypothetical protein
MESERILMNDNLSKRNVKLIKIFLCVKFFIMLSLAFWGGRTVESIIRAGVDLWTDASSTPE